MTTQMEAVYIYGTTGRIAKKVNDITEFYHTDHLGSTGLTTSETGSTVTEIQYKPFGEQINLSEEEYTYNRKELDDTGLYYYGARYYDPETGRFLTRDPLQGKRETPQTLNRYVYCLNNPLKYIDPAGTEGTSAQQKVEEVFARMQNVDPEELAEVQELIDAGDYVGALVRILELLGFEGCEDPVENQKVPAGHDPIDSKSPAHRVSKQKEITKQKYTTTRSLILQALSNGISCLKDIAYFADVDPSTAHYHLRNLVKEYRVTKVSWGEYIFSDQSLDSDGKFLNESGRTFEKLLKNFSHPGRGWRGFEGLHPLERNILMDILSKENKYEQFSERELARRFSISRYAAKKYTENLEKNKLITIKRENNQLVFTPTEVAIKGLTDFFNSVQTGSKIDSSSSKIQPLYPPGGNSMVANGDYSSQDVPTEPINMVRESPSVYTPSENILETFDDYLIWQQKNAHRMIIQFKLLRCSHPRLKGTGWIFGQKSIHRHFTEAYIFKSSIEERLKKCIQHIEDTQKLLHQNQSDISKNLVASMEIVRKIGEASESVARTAHAIMKEVQFLTAETQEEFGQCSYFSHCN